MPRHTRAVQPSPTTTKPISHQPRTVANQITIIRCEPAQPKTEAILQDNLKSSCRPIHERQCKLAYGTAQSLQWSSLCHQPKAYQPPPTPGGKSHHYISQDQQRAGPAEKGDSMQANKLKAGCNKPQAPIQSTQPTYSHKSHHEHPQNHHPPPARGPMEVRAREWAF